MVEKILPYERDLFFLLNHDANSPYMDGVMWLFSYTKIWIPFFAILLFAMLYKKKDIWTIGGVIVAVVLLVVLCDQISSSVFKPIFERMRPSKHPDFMNQVISFQGYRGGGQYGFISGHATNSFGIIFFWAFLLRRAIFFIIGGIWASVVALSRVYLGVHFVSDIVVGAIVGITIAFAIYKLYKFYLKKVNKEETIPAYPQKNTRAIAIALTSYIVLITVCSPLIMDLIGRG